MDKKNVIYLVILLALVAIFIIVKTTGKERETFFRIIDVDSTQIAKVKMFDKGDTLVLENRQGTWMITQPMEFPAGARKVGDLFSYVIKGRASSIPLAENESSHDAFNVSAAKGKSLELYDNAGNLLSSIVIGSSDNPSYSNVRKTDSPIVYQFEENVLYKIDPRLATWRKKEILEIVPETIEAIDVKYSRNAYSITATDTSWVFHDANNDFAVTRTNRQLLKILNVLEKGRSGRFRDNEWDDWQSAFDDPVLDVTVTQKTGAKTRFQVAQIKSEENSNLILKLNDDTSTLYQMSNDFVDRFTKSPEHFQSSLEDTQ